MLILLSLLLALPAYATESVAVSDVPENLHRPEGRPPPTPDDSRALVDDLLDRLRTEQLDRAWIERHVRPPHLPTGPSVTRWLRTLGADRPVGAALRNAAGPVAVLEGPAYQRVLLESAPGISAIVWQGDDGPVLVELEYTTCSLCPESTRFVVDLLDAFRTRGEVRGRLLPGVELKVDANRHGGSDWIGVLQQRNSTRGYLTRLLRTATVLDEDEDGVIIEYADGRQDRFHAVWEQGRWMLDYEAFSDDSPMRLTRAEAARWSASASAPSSSLLDASFAPVTASGGLDIGHGVIDGWFDPRDGTVWLLRMDLDRSTTALVSVDPQLQEVVDHWRLALLDERTRVDLDAWSSPWASAIANDGSYVALQVPSRLWSLDLERRKATLLDRGESSSVAWLRGPERSLLAARGSTLVTYRTSHRVGSRRAPAPVLAVTSVGDETIAICKNGSIFNGDEWVGRVCCGDVHEVATAAGAGHILAVCTEACGVAATIVAPSGDSIDLVGRGTALWGASISEDGRWATLGSADDAGHLVIWRSDTREPWTRLPVHPVRRARWAPDGSALLVIELDGRASWWSLEDLRAQPPL